MVATLVSAHVRKLWVPLPLIHFDSTFVLGIVRTLVCTGYDFDIAYEICQYVLKMIFLEMLLYICL